MRSGHSALLEFGGTLPNLAAPAGQSNLQSFFRILEYLSQQAS
jgi:hypothetical protein